MRRKAPLWKTPLPWVCLVLALQGIFVVVFMIGVLRSRSRAASQVPEQARSSAPADPSSPPASPAPGEPRRQPERPASAPGAPVAISLNDALGREWITVSYRGNGRDKLVATVQSRTDRPLQLSVPAGTLFESRDHLQQVVLVRTDTSAIGPRETRSVNWITAATRASNQVGNHDFIVRPGRLTQLDALLGHLERTPEVSVEAIQTAVLVILENPPLASFAKFTLVSGVQPGAAPSTVPDTFKVSTLDIIFALTLLKEISHPQRDLLLAHEPQLKIEAMIDPLAHAAAMRYYGLTGDNEWGFWRDELLNGDVSTRHYSLYGIARYFPDVALQMLPQWAREKSQPHIMRLAAISSLAETGRVEAISVLQQLAYEFEASSDLSQTAKAAIGFLENRRDQQQSAKPRVEFKDATPPPAAPLLRSSS